MAEMAAASFRQEPPPADIAIRLGSQQNLDDGADDGFALGPGSRTERRREIILSVGMLGQEPVGDNAIDENAIVGRIDQFLVVSIQIKSAKSARKQRAVPSPPHMGSGPLPAMASTAAALGP